MRKEIDRLELGTYWGIKSEHGLECNFTIIMQVYGVKLVFGILSSPLSFVCTAGGMSDFISSFSVHEHRKFLEILCNQACKVCCWLSMDDNCNTH